VEKSESGTTYWADTPGVSRARGLKHLGFGNFCVDLPDGERIYFERMDDTEDGARIKAKYGMEGRPHELRARGDQSRVGPFVEELQAQEKAAAAENA
jgi:hypothetical protein